MTIPKLGDTPKYIKVICKFGFWSLLVFCVLIMLKNERGRISETLPALLIALLIPTVFAVMIYTLYHVMDHFTCKHALLLLNTEYAEKGFTVNLPKYAAALHPLPTTDDRLLELYLTVMAENYDALPALCLRIEKRNRTARQQAMLDLCKMRALLMNGKSERAWKYFSEEHLLMDAAYEECPDLISQRVPHSYTDDTLTYCEMAACFCTHCGQLREAEHYRSFAELRISRYDEDERPFMIDILDIAMRHAAGEAVALRDRVLALEQDIREQFQLTQRGKYINLTRRLDQSMIYAALTFAGNAPDAERCAENRRFERRLPGADYLAGNGSAAQKGN